MKKKCICKITNSWCLLKFEKMYNIFIKLQKFLLMSHFILCITALFSQNLL